MSRKEFVYPAKQTSDPNGEFTIPRFFLPISICDEEMWALLDTGANISILPKELAESVIPRRMSPVDNGKYPLAGIVEVPYTSYEMNFKIFDYIKGTIPNLDLMPYTTRPNIAVELRAVEFQVPEFTWPEIAAKLDAESPLAIYGGEMDFAILGLYGVLDQLTLSFVGDNSVAISAIHP